MRYTLRKLKTMSCVGVTPGIMRFQVLQGYKRVISLPFLNSFQRRRREKMGFGSAPGAEKALWGVRAPKARGKFWHFGPPKSSKFDDFP